MPQVIATEARVHLRALLGDALAALAALDRGDYSSADASLRASMLAAADCRSALIGVLVTPAELVATELKDWCA